jgi:hypothetical protein
MSKPNRQRRATHRARKRAAAAADAVERQGFTVRQFGQRNNLGHDSVYKEIGAGRLIAHKVGAKTVIFLESEAAWRAALPVLKLRPRKARPAESVGAVA